MNYKKNAPADQDRGETETNKQEGTIMDSSITRTSTLSAEDRARLDAWCAEVRRRYEEASTPLEYGDPRMLEADRAQFAAMGWTPEQIGRQWAYERVEFPEWPLEVPSWASDIDVGFAGHREIDVLYTGRGHQAGDVSAWLSQAWMFDLDDGPDAGRDGPRGAPSIVHNCSDDELSSQAAFQLAAVLRSAAVELGAILAADRNEVAQ